MRGVVAEIFRGPTGKDGDLKFSHSILDSNGKRSELPKVLDSNGSELSFFGTGASHRLDIIFGESFGQYNGNGAFYRQNAKGNYEGTELPGDFKRPGGMVFNFDHVIPTAIGETNVSPFGQRDLTIGGSGIITYQQEDPYGDTKRAVVFRVDVNGKVTENAILPIAVDTGRHPSGTLAVPDTINGISGDYSVGSARLYDRELLTPFVPEDDRELDSRVGYLHDRKRNITITADMLIQRLELGLPSNAGSYQVSSISVGKNPDPASNEVGYNLVFGSVRKASIAGYNDELNTEQVFIKASKIEELLEKIKPLARK